MRDQQRCCFSEFITQKFKAKDQDTLVQSCYRFFSCIIIVSKKVNQCFEFSKNALKRG